MTTQANVLAPMSELRGEIATVKADLIGIVAAAPSATGSQP